MLRARGADEVDRRGRAAHRWQRRRVRVRALGHAAPDHQRARRHRARERRLVARSVAAARSRTAGSTASARADTKGAIAATLVALEDAAPDERRRAVLGRRGGRQRRDARVPRVAARARRSSEAIVCEPTARTAGIAHRGVLGQHGDARRRRRPLVEGRLHAQADRAARAPRGRARRRSASRRLARRPRRHARALCLNIAALHGGVAFNVIPQRGRARVVAAALPRLRSRRAGSARSPQLAARDRSGDRDRDDDRSRAVRVRPTLADARPAVRDVDRLARLLDRGRALPGSTASTRS